MLFDYYHQEQLPRGTNLNPTIDGVRPRTLRSNPVWWATTRFTYNLPLPSAGAGQGAGSGPQRYRASVYVSINNLTNHANLTGFGGVMTSPFFRTATAVQNPRKIDLGFNVAF